MVFEFVANPDFNFLSSFGRQFHIPVHNDTLIIPPTMGSGYVRKIELEPDLKLLVHQYRLSEEFVLKRRPSDTLTDLVSIICYSNEEPVSRVVHEPSVQLALHTPFAIQIASTDLDSEIRFPANTDIFFTVVGIRTSLLSRLLNLKQPNPVVETILRAAPGFLYYESMGPDLQRTLRQLTETTEGNPLSTLFYRIKVQELLYLLFGQLLKRETVRHSRVNRTDIKKLFVLRTTLLADLSKPPHLPQLAKEIGLSETKMKDLFRQVFGDSIYNYYQKARMDEAAFLLKQGGYSVSDTGSRLGFANLSHFSRQFEKQYGLSPKRYSSGG